MPALLAACYSQKIMRRFVGCLLLAVFGLYAASPARDPQTDPRLKKSYRRAEQNGWIYVHLEGAPKDIGFQHGYLLAPEIDDTFKVVSAGLLHDSKKNWAF